MTRWLLLALLSGQHVHDESPVPAPTLWGLSRIEPNATVGYKVEWSQEAPSLDAIWWYIYRVYLDTSPTGKQLGSAECQGARSPFPCSTWLPGLTTTVGTHTLTLTVARFVSGDSVQHPSQTGPETRSNPVAFTVRQPPPQMYRSTPERRPPVVVR